MQNIGELAVGFHREIASDDSCEDKVGKLQLIPEGGIYENLIL